MRSRNLALAMLGPVFLVLIWLVAWTLPARERDAAHENWRTS
jgi:hypothetical protein